MRPDFPQAHNSLGICLSHEKSFEKSYDHFAKAVELMPSYAEAWVNWGLVLATRRDTAGAIKKYRAAVAADPGYLPAHQHLARHYAKENDFKEAETHYREMVRLSSASIEGMSIRVDGTLINLVAMPTRNGLVTDATSLQSGPLPQAGNTDAAANIAELGGAPFEAILASGNLTLNWKGTEIFNAPVNWFPSSAQILFGGSTGGNKAAHHVDNIFLELTSSNQAAVSDVRFSRNFIEFDITDIPPSVLAPWTINVTADGNDITAGLTITKIGDVTTVRHDQVPPFPFGTPKTCSREPIGLSSSGGKTAGATTKRLTSPAAAFRTTPIPSTGSPSDV